jgi:hypothetical protein
MLPVVLSILFVFSVFVSEVEVTMLIEFVESEECAVEINTGREVVEDGGSKTIYESLSTLQ